MGVCPLFCSFGMVYMLVFLRGVVLRAAERPGQHEGDSAGAAPASAVTECGGSPRAGDGGGAGQRLAALRFPLTLAALSLVAAAQAALTTVWPYWLQDRYGWRDREYAPLLLAAAGLTIILTAQYP
eukprot:gene7730-113_t